MVSNLGSSILSDPIGSGTIASSPSRIRAGTTRRIATGAIPTARAVEIQLVQAGELSVSSGTR
jgi:hypothetical protein